MPTTILKVNAVYPPERNPKFGAVLGQDSNAQKMRLSVPAECLGMFQKGGTYTVDYDVTEGNKPGVRFYNFLRMADQAGMQTAGQAAGDVVGGLEAQARALMAKAEEAKKAQQQKTKALDKIHHDEELKAAQIFVTSVVGRAAGNGLQASDLREFALAAVGAWKAAMQALDDHARMGNLHPSTVQAGGAPVGPVPNTEQGDPGPLNDDIPF